MTDAEVYLVCDACGLFTTLTNDKIERGGLIFSACGRCEEERGWVFPSKQHALEHSARIEALWSQTA